MIDPNHVIQHVMVNRSHVGRNAGETVWAFDALWAGEIHSDDCSWGEEILGPAAFAGI
jgi:alkyl hydroperoxide reductase subunit AhpC